MRFSMLALVALVGAGLYYFTKDTKAAETLPVPTTPPAPGSTNA